MSPGQSSSDPPDPLAPYVPRLVVEWLATTPDQRHRSVEGTLAFVDISGFTKLTERLARSGKVGAEEMSETLDATFAALLRVAYEDGAGLVKWGGDAVLLLFDGPDHAARACRAAHRMRATMREVGRLTTSAGQVTLRMSVGIHSGRFDFFLVGDPAHHRELLVSGPGASRTAEAEAIADAGQIAITAETAALVDAGVVGAPKGDVLLLRSAPDVAWAEAPIAPDTAAVDLSQVVPPRIGAWLAAGPGGPEHRTVTVAFVEFSGTDALLARSGADALTDALDAVVRNVQDAVAAHDVTFFESDISRDGGKIMLTAGAPVTTDHDEERMLRAARRIVDRIGALPLRIGVNRGGVFAGDFGPPFRRTFSVKGDAVNLAARVMGKAASGQVLATPAVLDRSRTLFDVEPLAPFTVKGKSRPVEASSVGPVRGTRADQSRLGPLVGRDKEMQVLRGALDAARTGHGSAIEVVGEAGIGKSRLLAELGAQAGDLTTALTSCSVYETATPYAPFRALLRDLLGVARDAEPSALHAALVARVTAAAPDLVAWLPSLGPLLDLHVPDTEQTRLVDVRFRRSRLEEVTGEVLDALLSTPALLAIEDVHLMDEASVGLLERLVADVARRPWLVVVARRDQPTGYRPGGSVTSVRPEPLDPGAATALVDAGTAEDPLPPHELRQLVERADGNPFFLGALVAAARASGGVDALPDSLESVLNSQIDRLPPSERTVLRRASVLGLSFTEDELRSLLDGEDLPTGRASMRRLGEFVESEGHGRLRFRHALIRDAAYAGLPVRRRRELHGRIGDEVEASAADPDDHAELLSLHFFEAGRTDKAWRYARIAGARAADKYAFVDAVGLLRRAVEAGRQVAAVDADELARTYEALADAQVQVGVLTEAREAYRAARRLAASGSDAVRTADLLRKEARTLALLDRVTAALRTLTRGLTVLADDDRPAALAERARLRCAYARNKEKQGRYRDAVRWGREAERTARAAGDRRALAEAYEALHSASSMAGLDQPEPYGELALALFTELGDREAQSRALNNLAVLAWFDGRGAEALEMFEAARDRAAEAGDTLGTAASAHNVGDVLLRQGRVAEAVAVLEPLLPVFKSLGSDEYWASTTRWLGVAAIRSGDVAGGRVRIDTAREVFSALGLAAEVAETDCALVEAHLGAGDAATAEERAADALGRAVALDAGYLLPTLHRLRGVALLRLGQVEDAVTELAAALDACDTQGAAERGFVLADLAAATRPSDPAAATDLERRSAAALTELGAVDPR